MFGMQMGCMGRVGGRLSDAQKILALFKNGEQGAWYDPSDMSTLFQDGAGTVPVTAAEQPVGRILDKSGRGNHASQATSTKRPVLSARVNLLTKTEAFGDAVWDKAGITVGAAPTDGGSITAPDGTSTARLYTFSAGTFVRRELAFPSGLQGSAKVYVRAGLVSPATAVRITTNNTLNWSTGFSTKAALTREWQLVTHSGVLQTGSGRVFLMFGAVDANGANDADCVGSIELWHPSLVPADQASLPYQRVNTATDYDADPAKFPAYLRADGVDDSLTSSTGGGGTTGFFFSAAISPQGSAGTARTLFSDAGTNTGYIVRLNASNRLEFAAGNGTAYTTIATVGTMAVRATDVVQAWDDGTTLNVKIGSGPTASIARPVVSAGTAGYTLYQNNGVATGYFNGRSYGEIYRKDSGLTQSQREAVAVYQRKQARIA